MMKSDLITDKAKYLEAQEKFQSYFDSKYKNYLYDIQSRIKNDPKNFWKYFRQKRESKGYPVCMSLDDESSSKAEEIANMFAAFFQSVYKPEDIQNFTIPINEGVNRNVQISLPVITREQILSGTSQLPNGSGPDLIPTSILKMFMHELVEPLHIVFNFSLETGIFPDEWKISKITPIFKSGNRCNVANYRGIATGSMIPKLFEKLVCESFKSTLTKHISFNQHGFMPGRSTVSNLALFTSDIINELERHVQVDVIYTDFSKAFDSISHKIALERLYSNGFTLDFVVWLSSYLRNRIQYVEINNTKSVAIRATSGVPQGSHIGPLIFLVFIDSINDIIKNSKILLFADDVKLYHTIKSTNDSVSLQNDMNSLSKWCQLNCLHLNISKCKSMSFHRKKNPILNTYTINNSNIDRVTETTDLGVIFVENGTFNKHINICIAKANSMFGFIKRWTGEFTDQRALLALYFANIRSQLEYASVIWNPWYSTHINRIEGIQKKFLIFMLRRTGWDNYDDGIPFHENVKKLAPYQERCNDLRLCSLENRRKLLEAAFIGGILLHHTNVPCILDKLSFNCPARQLRNLPHLLTSELHCTNYGDNNPINRMKKSFNSVNELFDFNLTYDKYKNILKNFFLYKI